MLDSVHDDKNMAVHQGRMLISSPHHMAIRVVEESYDDVTDKSQSKIVYKEQKGAEDKPKKTSTAPRKRKGSVAANRRKKKKKSGFGKRLLILALTMGGIGLALLGLLGFLIAKFG